MKNLITDISIRCPAFSHIQEERILIGVSRSRNRSKYGLQAKVVPMRFEKGHGVIGAGSGSYYEMPTITSDGREILYIVFFSLPRFQNLDFDDKMMVIFHELYHISPDFNGDIRRFPGRFYQHSHSEKEYDRVVRELADEYLKNESSRLLVHFLQFNHDELEKLYGEVYGGQIRVPEPVLVKAEEAESIGIE